jgi:hypothetical protein
MNYYSEYKLHEIQGEKSGFLKVSRIVNFDLLFHIQIPLFVNV